jgi:short-subunit dehydrogenase
MQIMKHVLVTGASSGLGNALTCQLAKMGFFVFAGFRNEADKIALLKWENVYPIKLDITKKDEIESAFLTIRQQVGESGLYALVNNAGINYITPFEKADEGKERELMEINLLGAMGLTRRMMPLFRLSASYYNWKARIINVSSIGAIFGLPWEAAYHASKFALLGWSQSLRYELEALNISVSCFIPGGMKTRIFEKSIVAVSMKNEESSTNDLWAYYRKNLQKMNTVMRQFERSAADPQQAANSVVKLLKMKDPPLKCYFGKDAAFIRALTWIGVAHLLRGMFVIH